MLILTRKPGESIYIGDNVKVTVLETKGNQIRLGVDAPRSIPVYREEIYEQIQQENKLAAEAAMGAGTELDALAAMRSNVSREGERPEKKERPGTALTGARIGADRPDILIRRKKKKKTEDDENNDER